MLLLLFVAIEFIGSMLFACGLGFQKRTVFLRAMYMVIAVAWVVFTLLEVRFCGIVAGND